jgi:hypothetical protein
MLIITRSGITDAELSHVCERVEALGLTAHIVRGAQRTVVACVGDEDQLSEVPLLALPGIESVTPVLRPTSSPHVRPSPAGRPPGSRRAPPCSAIASSR